MKIFKKKRDKWLLFGLLGLVLFVVFWEKGVRVLATAFNTMAEMSPYLLFGFFVAGILSVLISAEKVEYHLGGRGLLPIIKAALFGVPLPLCSCGVIPVSASMYKHGASRAATISFLLSTPQTGVDSIMITYGLLGPVFAIFRALSAFFAGMFGGMLVDCFVNADVLKAEINKDKESVDSCCSVKDDNRGGGAVWKILKYAFVTLPKEVGGALLLGVAIAGLLSEFVPHNQLSLYVGGGFFSMLIMIIVGIPIYVCATASVPIAYGFIVAGASPGAALAFLIAGPATNAATFTVIWKLLGKKATVIYLISVVITALGSGLLLDFIIQSFSLPAIVEKNGDMLPNLWEYLSAIVLLGLLFFPNLYNKCKGKFGYNTGCCSSAPVAEKKSCCCSKKDS